MLVKELTQQVKEDLKNYFKERDYIVISVPKEEPIRLYVLKAVNTLKTVRRLFNPEGEDANYLGGVVIGALLLTSLVKHASPQKISLEIRLKERRYYAEADGKGRVRGFFDNAYSENEILTVTREVGLGKPYTSIVPLVSYDIQESINFYFYQSEQTRTIIGIYVDEGYGFLVQPLGGYKSTVWEDIGKNIKNVELMLKEGARPEDIAEVILRKHKPMLVGLKEVEYYCPCNEEIAKMGVFTLSEEERREILDSEGFIEVVCKFCNRIYRFSEGDLRKR